MSPAQDRALSGVVHHAYTWPKQPAQDHVHQRRGLLSEVPLAGGFQPVEVNPREIRVHGHGCQFRADPLQQQVLDPGGAEVLFEKLNRPAG